MGLHTNLHCSIILSLSVWYLRSCTYLVHSSGIRDRVCVLDDWYRLSCQDGLVNSQGGWEDLDETDISRYLVTNCKLLSKLLYKLLYSNIQHKSLQFFILIQSIETDCADSDFCVCHCRLFLSRLLTHYASATENTWYTTAPKFFILIQGTGTGNGNTCFHFTRITIYFTIKPKCQWKDSVIAIFVVIQGKETDECLMSSSH